MPKSPWMAQWYERKDWPPARQLGWLTRQDLPWCDWEDAIPDGWPKAADDWRYHSMTPRWHVAGVEKKKVYTEEEERELHVRQERALQRQLRLGYGEEMPDPWGSASDDGSGPLAMDAGVS